MMGEGLFQKEEQGTHTRAVFSIKDVQKEIMNLVIEWDIVDKSELCLRNKAEPIF